MARPFERSVSSPRTDIEVIAGQVWQDRDIRRHERFIRVIDTTSTDALVRSWWPSKNDFSPKTPRVWVSLNRLRARFALVTTPATADTLDAPLATEAA